MASSKQKLGEILAVFIETKKELGSLGAENAISEKLTIMGKPHTDAALISPLGKRECIYYNYSVTLKRSESYTQRDSNGHVHRRTRIVSDKLDGSSNCTRFWLNDGTGKVLVDPKNCTVDGVVVSYERSETQANNGVPETITYLEEIIGLDRPLTIVGTLCDKMGELMIESVEKSPVIISTASQEDMLKRTKAEAKNSVSWAVILSFLGASLSFLAFTFFLSP